MALGIDFIANVFRLFSLVISLVESVSVEITSLLIVLTITVYLLIAMWSLIFILPKNQKVIIIYFANDLRRNLVE